MSKSPPLNVRVSPELRQGLESLAAARQTSISTVARDALQGTIQKQQAGRYREIGVSGLEHSGGMVYEEFHKDLTGDRALDVYKEMLYNSPTIAGMVYAIDMLMRQAEWHVQPGGESSADDEAAEFVESCLDDMSVGWKDTLTEMLTFISYGWSYHEIVYKRRNGGTPLTPGTSSKYTDGRIGWRKLPLRAHTTRWKWEFGDDGSILGMWQADASGGARRLSAPVLIPIQKALLFRARTQKNNPEPPGILRGAYVPYYYAKRIQGIEAVGIERDLAGMPVARIPAAMITSSDSTVYNAWKEMVRKVRRNEKDGLVIPSDSDPETKERLYDFELLTTGGRRQFDINPIVERFERRMAMVALADFLFLGHEKVGSYALASSKTSIFGVAMGAWLDQIASIFNRHAIPRLLALNGFQLEALPTLEHGDIEIPDPMEIGEAVAKFTGSGMPFWGGPDSLDLENWARRLVGAPELTEDQYEERVAQEEEEKAQRMEEQRMAMDEFRRAGASAPPNTDDDAPANEAQGRDRRPST